MAVGVKAAIKCDKNEGQPAALAALLGEWRAEEREIAYAFVSKLWLMWRTLMIC